MTCACRFGIEWYTEKYSRDEEALEEHIKKTYLRNAQEAQAKMPQLAATIRGQSTSLDGNMDKLVWGGKAKLKHKGGNGTEAGLALTDTDESEEDGTITSNNDNEEPKTTRKRKKKKRKKDKRSEEERRTKELEEQQKSLILKSSIAGVAVGAVAVAAVSVFLGGGGTSGRK